MKRLLSAALGLSLLGSAAAQAGPFDHGARQHERHDGGRDHGWGHDRGWGGRHHHGDGAGAAIAVGVGLIALTAILASQNRDGERDNDRYDGPPPPQGEYGPPPAAQEYGPPSSSQDYGPEPRDDNGPGDRDDNR